MGTDVIDFEANDATRAALVGGKGSNLAALARVDGIDVPPGFCVSTDAFRRVVGQAPSIGERIDRLARLMPDDREAIAAQSAEVRAAIEALAIPDDLAGAIGRAVTRHGEGAAYAVRSSATAEDLPSASFAGQHDSFLDIVGAAAIVRHVSRCWASLFTERAVTYRLRNGVDQRDLAMAVVVQRMVLPHAAGVLFTADPVTSNRRVASVEAVPGLGEALVSGHVNADVYTVRDGALRTRAVAGDEPVLTEEQVVRLVALGRRIEAQLGRPQDIEWCLADYGFQIVQSRPITTLFPIPAADDDANRVYVSVGHQQMMTDPLRPLGLSIWQLTAMPRMYEAGGRLFVDVAERLASPAARAATLDALGSSDPLIGDALRTIVARGDFIPTLPDDGGSAGPPAGAASAPAPPPIENDPAIVSGLIERTEASVATLAQEIRTHSGPALFDFLRADIQELKRLLFEPVSHQAIMAGMEATAWLNERLAEWLGEHDAADTLAQSAPGNITSEMGLALLDVADAIRPYPEVVAFLRDVGVSDDGFLDAPPDFPGWPEARDAIVAYLDRYGARCVGEIDITRPRWIERPSTLVPLILNNIASFEPGAGQRRFEHGRQQALEKEREVLDRLRALPGGDARAAETKWMIDRIRTFNGYREYPKFHIVTRFLLYKRALLEEAERLVRDGVLRDAEEVFQLTFGEFHEAVRTRAADAELIAERTRAFASYAALTPPRVLTSEGEVVSGSYRRERLPTGALAGLPVSAGTIEGRARVIHDISEADLEPGDILVTTFTDPSWSPLFVAVEGLVTEVGGLMTHGAVIAREYGLPAVVGVEQATRLIEDGQRIRVHGSDGYVEILD